MEENKRDVAKKITISFYEIVEYFGGFKRSICLGEEIVNAGWVYAIGIAAPPARNRIIGLVVKVSSMTSTPHEVKLDNITESHSSWKCMCTCKAGEGRKCKHIAACLIQINRDPNVFAISCTELKQKWGKNGKKFAEKYSAVCASDMCHTRRKVYMKDDIVSEEQQTNYVKELLEVAPDSELSKLFYGTRSAGESQSHQSADSDDNDFFRLLIQHDGLSSFVPYMQKFITLAIDSHYRSIAKTVEEIVHICKTTICQNSAYWLLERKCRITGSISYSLYTYASNKFPNWDHKLSSIYNSNFKGNEATRYGQYAEKLAKNELSKCCLLFEAGLIISPDLPFLAYSADGVAYDGDIWKLVEIKSPVKGKEIEAANLLQYLKYLSFENGQYILNHRHSYYGQIQLGLAITNFLYCDLIIFSTFNNSYEVIKVPRNENFIKIYVETLCDVYFQNIVPFILKK